MQTTLLGLAIAFILALIAALAGPYFVDWNQYRADLERHASGFVGVPVRVGGDIDVRILPVPSLVLHQVEVGKRGERPKLRADVLDIKLALGQIFKGELHAAELRLVGPEFRFAMDRTGRVETPMLGLGGAQTLSIERLSVEDGRAVVTDAGSGGQLALNALSFDGEVRSLTGPFRGEGSFISGGERYGYRVVSGRVGDGAGTKLRLNLEPSHLPLTIDTDGTLVFDNGAPTFEGTLALRRAAKAALRGGAGEEPWSVTARVKATRLSALFEQAELQYGAEARAIKLNGSAEIALDGKPRLTGALVGRQIDLDRALDLPDATRRFPVAAVGQLAQSMRSAVRFPGPAHLSVSVDGVTFAGAGLTSVSADVEDRGDGWNLDRVEFRAPGLTQVSLSGKLAPTGQGAAAFNGAVALESSQPQAFLSWLQGGADVSLAGIGSLQLAGDVATDNDRIAVERLRGDIDRRKIEGRVSYAYATANRPARLDAALRSSDVDIDDMIGLASLNLTGTSFQRPGEVALALDIDRATIAGVEARGATAKLTYDKTGLAIERFVVNDVGGAKVEVVGRLPATPAARGEMAIRLDAQSLDGVAAIVAKYAPNFAPRAREIAARYVPAKLAAHVSAGGTGARSELNLKLDGAAGAFRLKGSATAAGDLATVLAGDVASLVAADWRSEADIQTEDARALARVFGLERVLGGAARRARLTFDTSGPLRGDMRIKARFLSEGVDATAGGTLRWTDERPLGNLDVGYATTDAEMLRRTGGAPVPLKLQTKLSLLRNGVALDQMSGNVAGTAFTGRLALGLDQPALIDGKIAAEAVDVSTILALAVGMPAPRAAGEGATSGATGGATWTTEPFVARSYRAVLGPELSGQVEVEAKRATFAPNVAGSDLRATVRFERAGVSFDNVTARLAEGTLAAQARFRDSADGLSADASLDLRNANISLMVPSNIRPPALGRLSLKLEAQGSGRSPAALIGALAGTGTLALERGELASLNPLAIDATIDAADRGLAIDRDRVGRFTTAALDTGRLNVPLFNATVAINSGLLRVLSPVTPAQSADAAITGSYDLSEDMLDLRVTLIGAPKADAPNGQRPEVGVVVRGPLATSKRTVEVASLVEWLTMRAVNREAKRLEAIEAATSSIPAVPPGPQAAPPPAASAPLIVLPAPAIPAPFPPVPATSAPNESNEVTPAPTAPRAAAVPQTQPPAVEAPAFERAPELPPALEIRPLPGPGDRRAPAQRSQQLPRPPTASGSEGRVRPPLDLSVGAQN